MPNPDVSLTLIQQARAKIADPQNWVRHVSARDSQNFPVSYGEPTACRFCIIGALASSESKPGEYNAAHKFLADLLPPEYAGWLSSFNDAKSTQHADVLALFDRAIGALQ